MKTKLFSLFCFLVATLPAADALKRAITHEDLWLMKRVGAPVPSPDGKWAVFSVTQPAYEAKDTSADLWLVPLDGSAPARQLTQTKAPESGAEWSPDATRVAFSTKRDGDEVAQIYVLDVVRGGEAEPGDELLETFFEGSAVVVVRFPIRRTQTADRGFGAGPE